MYGGLVLRSRYPTTAVNTQLRVLHSKRPLFGLNLQSTAQFGAFLTALATWIDQTAELLEEVGCLIQYGCVNLC
jgi:hypothetical protein